MYLPHPNAALNHAFGSRPFQGADPDGARFLFVGLDANYDSAIDRSSIWPALLEYLCDGVAFWRVHGVHHPFLLTGYRGDGRKYHKTFARIGFRPEHAAQVSFIEPVNVPTYGRSALVPGDLDRSHLLRLRHAIEEGAARWIFVPDGVGKLMASSGLFPWMPKAPVAQDSPLKVWATLGPKVVYWHYHFSVYGKYEQMKTEQLRAIGRLIGTTA